MFRRFNSIEPDLWARAQRGAFLGFGIAFLLVLNIRYFIEGAPAAISFFIGIYDVLDNLGVAASHGAAALAACPDNACTVWGDRYLIHPSWGVAFHERFLNGPALRTGLLYAHLGLNSIVFVLMHIQLMRPGTGSHSASHRLLGRISFLCLTVGTICAIWLASEHGPANMAAASRWSASGSCPCVSMGARSWACWPFDKGPPRAIGFG